MKRLNYFRTFDWEAFASDKAFACTGVRYSESKKMVVADIVIISDETDYDGDVTVTNRFEKFKVSIPNSVDANQFINLVNHEVEISNIQKISVYGDYSDQLSLVASVSLV